VVATAGAACAGAFCERVADLLGRGHRVRGLPHRLVCVSRCVGVFAGAATVLVVGRSASVLGWVGWGFRCDAGGWLVLGRRPDRGRPSTRCCGALLDVAHCWSGSLIHIRVSWLIVVGRWGGMRSAKMSSKTDRTMTGVGRAPVSGPGDSGTGGWLGYTAKNRRVPRNISVVAGQRNEKPSAQPTMTDGNSRPSRELSREIRWPWVHVSTAAQQLGEQRLGGVPACQGPTVDAAGCLPRRPPVRARRRARARIKGTVASRC